MYLGFFSFKRSESGKDRGVDDADDTWFGALGGLGWCLVGTQVLAINISKV